MRTGARGEMWAAAAVLLGVTACHTGGGYTIGGNVTGLHGSGLVLQDNSGDDLPLSANGSFVFTSGIDQGGAYSVTVKTQPSNPAETCAVHNGSGTIGTADIDNVVVSCTQAGRFAYVVNESSNSISAFSIDQATGVLTPIPGSPFASTGTTPVAAVVDHNGTYLYVANHASNSVSVYAIDSDTGELTSAGEPLASGNGPFALLVDPSNQFLYVANMMDNTVSVFVIDSSTGLATPINGSPFDVGTEPTSLATDPGGNFLYVTDYANGSVAAFSIEAGAGSIAAIGGSPFAADTGALSIAIDPTGTFAYVANESADALSLYSINADTGSLAPLSGSPLGTGSSPESVTVDPAGRFLFVANVTGKNELTSYSITPASGEITPVSTVAAGGFPLSVVIDPAGTFAYVANEDTDNVSVYSIDSTTGALTPVRGSPFAAGVDSRSIAID
ncbi:MAG TPA: beta-propeller fold lactonase family protein [Steroidobacteraceae bacterium]|nr:beta-propeller fold lactonase family protein [Steroidobacteraceae bacterium]